MIEIAALFFGAFLGTMLGSLIYDFWRDSR
jgi:hypothetical protein